MTADFTGPEMRRHERFPCPHLAQINLGDEWRDCHIHDLSGSGAHVVFTGRPQVGKDVRLYVQDVAELRGQVVRHTERGFALCFDLAELWIH